MNIVIVEDSELIREQLIRLLTREPRFHVAGVATGEDEAVALILATRPDVLLLDLALAPGSGLAVLERIRRAGVGSRALILTNNPAPALRQAGLSLGANGFYDKSADLDACFARLRAWLPPLPPNESSRLAQLHALQLLDGPDHPAFDRLTRLAASITGTPLAMISLVDADRQWFLSRLGTELRETSRDSSFCTHAILHHGRTEVEDSLQDARFHDNPLVMGEPQLRFYAAEPITLPSGETLGTLCVADRQPRQLSPAQREALHTLAGCVLSEIELRRRLFILEHEASRRQAAESHILHLATRDPLTALPNRVTFRDRLDQHVRFAQRRHTALAVLIIDLDRFKPINDTLGHEIGDDMLVAVADRLSRCLRGSDTVARLGSDEFAVVLPEVSGATEALQLAGRLLEAIEEPLATRGHVLHLAASIGVALYPEHGKRGDELQCHADLAMYHAKQSGGRRCCLYARQFSERAEALQALDTDLREALRRRDLILHYQPQVALGRGQLCGVEALVRWRHPHFGLLPPDHFIPLAEQRGFIHELSRQVLDMALSQLKAWDAEGLHVPRVAVNVSPVEIRADFPDMVEAALYRHDVSPGRLELEITESTLTADGIDTLRLLQRLRAQGISIAVDDFGVGYSSLGQLHRLPIDTLKIDRSFVQHLAGSPANFAIVQAVVSMSDALGLRTVAEGVEEQDQMHLLERLGCQCAQGYHLSRPQAAEDLGPWLRTRLHDRCGTA